MFLRTQYSLRKFYLIPYVKFDADSLSWEYVQYSSMIRELDITIFFYFSIIIMTIQTISKLSEVFCDVY